MRKESCVYFFYSSLLLVYSYCMYGTVRYVRSILCEDHDFAQVIVFYSFEKKTTTTMSRWFRSEPMEYISLIVNEDAAHDCLADLGKMGVIQFTDVREYHSTQEQMWS